MKQTSKIALAASIGMMIATAALADGGPRFGHGPKGDPMERFEQMDANNDGEVTREEMEAGRTARFTEADADGDGVLSREEVAAAGAKRGEERALKMLERLDANGDGTLSEDEMPKPRGADRMFARLDTDDSGGISKEEFEEAAKHRRMHGDKGGKKRWHRGE